MQILNLWNLDNKQDGILWIYLRIVFYIVNSGMENYPVIFSIKSIPVIYENIKRNGS